VQADGVLYKEDDRMNYKKISDILDRYRAEKNEPKMCAVKKWLIYEKYGDKIFPALDLIGV